MRLVQPIPRSYESSMPAKEYDQNSSKKTVKIGVASFSFVWKNTEEIFQ